MASFHQYELRKKVLNKLTCQKLAEEYEKLHDEYEQLKIVLKELKNSNKHLKASNDHLTRIIDFNEDLFLSEKTLVDNIKRLTALKRGLEQEIANLKLKKKD